MKTSLEYFFFRPDAPFQRLSFRPNPRRQIGKQSYIYNPKTREWLRCTKKHNEWYWIETYAVEVPAAHRTIVLLMS